jgi:2-polyprenyl-6-hydroxyphenyl methylase/3-demethylubiquinone-9 3-methyltransferase
LAKHWNDRYRQGGFRRRLGFVRDFIGPCVLPGACWLDAGCGGGILTLELSRLGAHGLAVDGSPEMIETATREVASLTEGFSFRCVDDISSVDVAAGIFDGALCSSVVEYVDDIDRALSELNRVLKLAGKLIVSVPNRNSPIRLIQKSIRWVGRLLGFDPFAYLGVSINAFSRQALVQRLGHSGFRTLSVEGFNPFVLGAAGRAWAPALYFVVAEKIGSPGGRSAVHQTCPNETAR